MQRICCLGALSLMIAVVGCGKDKPRHAAHLNDGDARADKDVRKVVLDGDVKIPNKVDDKQPVEVVANLPEASAEERKEAALLEAIDLLAEKKYPEALAALRKAQQAKYTESVEQEIFKVKAAMDRSEAADKAVSDVKTVLNDGKADEAATLAGQALEQFGGGDQAAELAKLKQQADAVVTSAADDTTARFAALKAEGQTHVEKKNYRAAVVALEQALAVKADQVLSERLAEIRTTVKTYDDNRALASGLRKDPTRLEEALTYLRKARTAWDTLEVRQEIDEYTLILERRRDRIAVADFEVRGDVGVPAAGRTIAEELLPHFKPRFDVVERGQLGRVLDELKLEADDLADNAVARKELGRASRVRYLVVGSVTTVGGVTVSARLVEAATGLIVQTARVTAPDVESILPKLKQVALILQLDDAQKLDFEAKLAKTVVVVKPIEAAPVERIDPVPVLPAQDVRPPQVIVTQTPAPLPLGNVVIKDFQSLPPVVVVQTPPPPRTLIIQGERKNRLLRLSLELGDNLLRCRRFREAERHFSLALTLAGPRREISLRLDTCRKFLPPPPPPVVYVPRPVVVVQQQPVVQPVVIVSRPVRPRLAVFGFVPCGNPGLVPAAMGDWAADCLTPYLGTNFELIERGEVCWYMGRLGLTMADLLRDGEARLALARALNARFFVFGTIQPTASYNVTTHLIDAESGARTGTADIHVQDQSDLKLRMSELVKQMGVKPDEQKELAKDAQATEKALNDSRALLTKDPAKAAETARAALKTSPNNVALAAVLADAERKQKVASFDAARQKEAADREKAIADSIKRQKALAEAATLAKEKAAKDAAARTEQAQKQQQAQREQAAANLRAQAKQASAKGDPARAVQLLQSAVSLKADDAAFSELAAARAAADKAKQAAVEADKKKRDAAVAAQREAAQKRIDDERKAREKADAERKKTQEAHDTALHDGLMKQAKDLFAKKDYAHALAAAQSAHKAKASAESNKMIHDVQDAIAVADAEKKGAEEKKRLLAEQQKRDAAAAQAKKNQDAYLAALNEGNKLMAAKKYEEAAKQYKAAQGLFATDAALNGLKAAEQSRKQEQDALAAQKAAKEAESKKDAQLKTLLAQGKSAMDARQYVKAVDLYKQAGKVAPGNVDALAGLSRAEHERDADAARAKAATLEKDRHKAFAGQVAAAEKALGQNKKAEAASLLREALKLYPNDAKAKTLLAKAESGTPKNPNDEDYKLAMDAGADAMKKGNYQGAVNSYRQALVKKPNDAAATKALAEAQRLLKAEQDKPKEAAYQAAMKQAQTAAAAKSWAAAVKSYDAALAQKPNDPAATAGRKAAQAELNKPDPKESAYQAAMKQARTLFDTKKYAEAVKAYDVALTNKPGDAAAIAGKKAAQAEANKPDPKAEEAKKKEAAYNAAMKQAQAAAAVKKWADAVKAYDAALAQKPNDPAATAGRKTAVAELNKPDPRAEEAKKKEAAYQAAMKQARTLFDGKKYADAVKAYDLALQNKPGDATAIAGKKAATDAQKPAPKVDGKAEMTKAIGQAVALEKQKKYADATTAYRTALKWATDLNDKAGQAQAYLGVARNEHVQNRYAEAVAAYEEVLKRDANNAEAKAALPRAKANKQ